MINIIDTNYINNLLNKADKVIAKEVKQEEVKQEEIKTELLLIEDTEDSNSTNDLMEKANAKIELIKDLEGINIEKIGVWVWIDGDTKAHKDTLKDLGFKYASKKQMWYYNPDATYRKRTKKTFSKEEMEALHGFEVIK